MAKLAFDNDLRICGNGQPCVRSTQHFHRLFSKSANPVEFGKTRWNLITRCQEEKGINTDDGNGRTRLPALEVLVAVQPSMLARRDVTHADVRFDDLNPIRPGVDPSGIRISRNH